MNKIEKEVAKTQLNAEDKSLKEMKQIFTKAKKDCQQKIAELNARQDMQNIQSIVHQKKFQDTILKQIDSTLKELESGQYSTAEQFLHESYDNGYLGMMYSLQGQGIPIISPINDRDVQRALIVDSKLSSKYYKQNPLKGRLEENITLLKTRVRTNLSRGLVAGKSWVDVAVDIASGMNNPFDMAFRDAMRIVRTEGHRVNQQGFLDAGDEAKKKGADIVKQWDATLDGLTRPAHMEADGQIVEWDEDFTVGGEKMKAPSIGGSASNVINCRCQLLQRAKWALDESELETLQKRAEYFGLDKSKNFEDFKKKYLKLPANTDTIKIPTPQSSKMMKLDKSNFPSQFTSKKAEANNTQMLVDYINSSSCSDPNVVKLFSKMGDVQFLDDFKITHAKNHAVSYRYGALDGKYSDVKLIIPKLEQDNIGAFDTTIHEEMHFMDMLLGSEDARKGWFSSNNTELVTAFKNADTTMSEEVKTLFASFKTEYDDINQKLGAERRRRYEELKKVHDYGATGHFDLQKYDEYRKATKEVDKWYENERDKQCRGIMGGGVHNLQDIYDAISGGQFRDIGAVMYGHGSKYYRRSSASVQESLANYATLSIGHPELVEILERDKPEIAKALKNAVSEMVTLAEGRS